MADDSTQDINPIRQTSPQAIQLAKTLMRSARFGALAVLDATCQEPLVSRVAVATSMNGAPLLLISSLSTHTKALLANPRCSLLLGEPGKGDPLAHPRVSIQCEADFLDRNSEAGMYARARYLRRNPKSKLYVDFGDFSFVKLHPNGASLNGGFGQAFRLTALELLVAAELTNKFEQAEIEILDHLNNEHQDIVQDIGSHFSAKSGRRWKLSGVDPEGVDLASADTIMRAWYKLPAMSINDVHSRMMDLATQSRR